MADRGDRLRELHASLLAGHNVLPALQSLNTLLEAAHSRSDVLEVASVVTPQLLFRCLNAAHGDDDLIGPCCAVMDKIFSSMSPVEVANYCQYVELGLQHASPEVRKVSLQALKRNSHSDAVRAVVLAPTMLHLVTQVVGDDSLECARLATDVFLAVVAAPQQLDVKLKEAFLIDLAGLMAESDTVRYRVYDLIVTLALRDDEAFTFVQSTHLLHKLVGELELDDILVKLNCIELLMSLLDSLSGLAFLKATNVLGKLHSLLLSVQQDPLGSLIVPGILKFFGHTALHPGTDVAGLCSDYPEFLPAVLAAVSSVHEDTIWGVAADTFGAVGSTVAGRKALVGLEDQVQTALKTLGAVIAGSQAQLRIRALGVVTMLMSCEEDEGSVSKGHEWFNLLHGKSFSTLMLVVRQPFEDLRTGALRVLLTIAKWEWGQREMHGHPGFLEYLLDRRTEPDRIGKELKYDVVHTLVTSTTAEGVFGSPAFLKLRQYAQEGPFFISAESALDLGSV